MARQHIEVAVAMEDRETRIDRDCADKAIDQFANGLASTSAVAKQSRRVLIMRGFGRENGGPRKQSTKIIQMSLIPRTRQYLHSNRAAGGNVRIEQLLDAITDRRAGVTKKFDPGGCIDQNHVTRLVRRVARSPSQPDPRSRRASSTPSGSAARVLSAKFIASRFVERW